MILLPLAAGCMPVSNEILRPPSAERDMDGDGFSGVDGDCDDRDPAISPDAEEIPYNLLDDDCDPGTPDDDVDRDGFLRADDCDDAWAGSRPDNGEECTDGRDGDCDGLSDGEEPGCAGYGDAAPTLAYHTFFANEGQEHLTNVVVHSDGEITAVGFTGAPFLDVPTIRPYTNLSDVHVVRFGPDGQPRWITYLGGAEDEVNPRVLEAEDGGLWVIGTTGIEGWGEPRWPFYHHIAPFLARLDADGQLLWHGFIDNPESSFQFAYGLIGDGAGGVYVSIIWEGDYVGFDGLPAVRAGDGFYSMVVLAFDAEGDFRWSTALGTGTDRPEMQEMASPSSVNLALGDGRLYVGMTLDDDVDLRGAQPPVRARTVGRIDTDTEGLIAALDTDDGALIASTYLGGSGKDVLRALLYHDGALYAGGDSDTAWGRADPPFAGGYDSWIAKLDPDLNLEGLGAYGPGAGRSNLHSLAWADGLWAGLTTERLWDTSVYGAPGRAGSSEVELVLLKVDADLQPRWYAYYGSDGPEGGQIGLYGDARGLWAAGSGGMTWGSPLRPYVNYYDGELIKLDLSGVP